MNQIAWFSICLFLVYPLLLEYSFAQELTVGAQIRPRAEFRNGFKTLTEDNRDAAFFVEQRTRLWTDYRTDKFRVHINFQDVRIWGAVDQIFKDDPSLFNIFEGYGEYYINPQWGVRMGRMELNYDNERFLGGLGWAAQGRSHDAMMVRFHDDSTKINLHVGVAFNQTADPPEPRRLFETIYTGVSNYKHMQFVWLQKKMTNTDLAFLFHNDGRQVLSTSDTSVSNRQTYMITADHRNTRWNAGGQLGYQGGENGSSTEVSAVLASAYFTWKTDLTPITLGIDYLSGTSLNDSKDKSFDPLYGTNHKFYGYMDYFYVGNFHGQASTTSGLNDLFLKTKWTLGEKSSLSADIHYFSSPATLYDPADNVSEIDRYLGTELDLVFTWVPVKSVVLNLGYSQMWAGSSMEAIKSTPGDHTALNNWAWLMVDFAPVIFKKDFGES